MDMPPLTHEQLLTLARKVQAAAHDADPERLEFCRQHLAERLTAHLEAEQVALSRLSRPRRELLFDGQHRLTGLLEQLDAASREQKVSERSEVADELLDRLSHQASNEQHALRQEWS